MNNISLNVCEFTIFILNGQKQILLQKNKNEDSNWTFSTGYIKNNDVKTSIIEKIKEELNIDILKNSLIELSIDKIHSKYFYYTYINIDEKDFTLAKEIDTIKWFSLDTVINMLSNSKEDIIYKLLHVLNKRGFLKVMFKNKGIDYEYKIDEVNIANIWNPHTYDPKEMGGFNYSTEDKILRWLVRGDTIYDVIIPIGSEIIDCPSKSSPHGVFRSNKIILTSPRVVSDEMALNFYLKSNLPEISYFKSLAGTAIRGYRKTSLKIIEDKVNKDNIDLVLSEIEDFIKPYQNNKDENNNEVFNEVMSILYDIKNS